MLIKVCEIYKTEFDTYVSNNSINLFNVIYFNYKLSFCCLKILQCIVQEMKILKQQKLLISPFRYFNIEYVAMLYGEEYYKSGTH